VKLARAAFLLLPAAGVLAIDPVPFDFHAVKYLVLVLVALAACAGAVAAGLFRWTELSLPLWVVFHFAYHLRPTSLLALAYLWGYGLTWAGFGLWMALMNFTEIFQFKLKYALMILYLGTTLFVAHPLSPFLTLQVLLNPDGLSPANGPFLAGSFAWVVGALALVAAGLGWSARRAAAPPEGAPG